MQRIDVGVLGATGMVGQQFIAQLANHPWFRLTWVGASERSAGQTYRSAAPWRLPVSIPAGVADLVVQEARPGAGHPPELLFSAMDVKRAYMYFFNDSDEPSYHASSGLTRNFEPKPSFHAAAHLYRSMGEYRFNRVVAKIR